MIKVITYGTYDFLHHGHIRLLERAKALGDYLIVGVTAEDYDKVRGKINVQQSLMERVEAVRATGIADEIIIEEYEGQKIDDIRKYDVDIFAIGSDWVGRFDYLKEYCKVVYLERTQGISSSAIRAGKRMIRLGLIGDSLFINKMIEECNYVNGMEVTVVCTNRKDTKTGSYKIVGSYEEILDEADAVYVRSLPQHHYEQIKKAIEYGKHVLCEAPLTLNKDQTKELFNLANEKNVILMEAIKTAYATAYSRLLLLIKGGKIGDIISVDATCTSLKNVGDIQKTDWDGIHEWGPTALLPVFQLLGTDFKTYSMISHFHEEGHDSFVKMDFVYDHAVASIKVGDGVKSEGDLVISGTVGYVYVPAPWWKTDYFEIRYEDQRLNKRYFYQLDGEGIRYELVAFARAIDRGRVISNIDKTVTMKMAEVMSDFSEKRNMMLI